MGGLDWGVARDVFHGICTVQQPVPNLEMYCESIFLDTSKNIVPDVVDHSFPEKKNTSKIGKLVLFIHRSTVNSIQKMGEGGEEKRLKIEDKEGENNNDDQINSHTYNEGNKITI